VLLTELLFETELFEILNQLTVYITLDSAMRLLMQSTGCTSWIGEPKLLVYCSVMYIIYKFQLLKMNLKMTLAIVWYTEVAISTSGNTFFWRPDCNMDVLGFKELCELYSLDAIKLSANNVFDEKTIQCINTGIKELKKILKNGVGEIKRKPKLSQQKMHYRSEEVSNFL
jgi:hypothetical protein